MNTPERNKEIFKFSKEYLINHLPQVFEEKDLDKYFVGDAREAASLKDVFCVFVQSAQEYQRMPNVIQYTNRKETIAAILCGFDFRKVSCMDEMELYKTFREAFDVTSKEGFRNSWYKWSCSIVDAAKFICGFKDIDDFAEFVNRFSYNTDTRMALPLLISTKIRGMGFALACNALKELGYLDYPKPDIHMIDICEALGLSNRNPYEVFEAIVRMAEDNDVTPYEVDKIWWLISSGRFYHDSVYGKPHKEEFIIACKDYLKERGM